MKSPPREIAGSKILITGGDGRLARCLKHAFEAVGAAVWAPGRRELDLLKDGAFEAILGVQPDWILHPAGMTQVDRCERDVPGAMAANVGTTRVVVRAAQSLRCGGIYISTDYVFGASGQAPYQESDPRGPMNVYGNSKSLAEDIALEAGLAVARVSWLFGDGQGFEAFVLKMAQLGEVPLANQWGTPTEMTALSQALQALTFQAKGIYHLVGAESVSRKQWAELILTKAGLTAELPVYADLFEGKAPRPVDSSLKNTRRDCVTLPGVSTYY